MQFLNTEEWSESKPCWKTIGKGRKILISQYFDVVIWCVECPDLFSFLALQLGKKKKNNLCSVLSEECFSLSFDKYWINKLDSEYICIFSMR